MTRCEVYLKLPEVLVLHVESYVNLTHVEKISGALDQGHDLVFDLGSVGLIFELVSDLLTVVLMIMAAKNQVNSWDLPGKLLVMPHTHMRQGDDVVATVLFTKLLRVLDCAALVVLVEDLDLEVLEHVDPLLLCDADEADLQTAYFHDSCAGAAPYAHWPVCRSIVLHQVGHDPLAVAVARL